MLPRWSDAGGLQSVAGILALKIGRLHYRTFDLSDHILPSDQSRLVPNKQSGVINSFIVVIVHDEVQ